MCEVIKGISIGKSFHKKVLEGTFNGSVHSVFERVCNLCTDDERLYSLAQPETGNFTNTLLIEMGNATFSSLKFEVNAHFYTIGQSVIVIGNKYIDISNVKVWHGERSALPPLSVTLIRKNLFFLKRQMKGQGSLQGLAGLIGMSVPLLCHGMKLRNPEIVSKAAKQIVGLGPGLTPAGDDFLAGFLASLYWGRLALGIIDKDFGSCVRAILRIAKKRTNKISYTEMIYAGLGITQERIANLLQHLYFYYNEKNLVYSIDEVLKIGHTSGTDLITGIGSALEYLLTEEYLIRRANG